MISNFKNKFWLSRIIFFLLVISLGISALAGCSKTKLTSNSKVQIYKSASLGLSITFPASWSDKYTVKETAQGIFVYFKPTKKVSDNAGLYFCILKKTKDLNESMYDSINGKKEVNVNGISYFLGGPTDVNFPEDHPEFNTFVKLQSQVPDIINSIKPLN
ncbi:MAG: hypothetical protein K0R54_3128 [Clostridiaceae bacterium]|jgi:hypothetical protein|nr:hypothetical protein [Clostridiaceae bacterium]